MGTRLEAYWLPDLPAEQRNFMWMNRPHRILEDGLIAPRAGDR
jgi:hypothetical protein